MALAQAGRLRIPNDWRVTGRESVLLGDSGEYYTVDDTPLRFQPANLLGLNACRRMGLRFYLQGDDESGPEVAFERPVPYF
jgi:hypothetical protein